MLASIAMTLPCGAQALSPALADAKVPPAGAAPDRRARSQAISWSLIYTSDLNADVAGGAERGAAYLQRIGLIADLDLQEQIGWRGARAHASVHVISGTGLSTRDVGNFLTVSGVEAESALRLFNLWVEQRLGERVTLRLGQFNVDQQFAIGPTASRFVNASFGWPASFASDLPSGSPVYPLAAPGVSLTVAPSPQSTLRAAMFAGGRPGSQVDPQRHDLHGFGGLRFKGQPFLIGEYERRAAGADPTWSVKLGGWIDFDRFADLRAAAVDPTSASAPATVPQVPHRRNFALYAIADMRVWRSGVRSLRVFGRASGSPGDRNPVDFYVDAGAELVAPIRTRSADRIGLGIAFARLSPRLARLRRAACPLVSIACRTPGGEAVIEVSYQVSLGEQAHLQPNIQYVVHPAAGLLAGAADPDTTPRNAVVIGLRTALQL